MGKLTDEQKSLIMKIKDMPLDKLYELADEYSNKITELYNPDAEDQTEREALIDKLQIVIIRIALKKGNYDRFIQTKEEIDELFDTPAEASK